MSDALRQSLSRSNYIFSGIKTFHEMNEAFPSLLDENGNRKPFERFLNDVHKIDQTYNRNYLRAEYNFAQASAQMAEKIASGLNVALVSDAGTPGISDPGFMLVRECIRLGVEVECLPGATAFVPALVQSGLPNEKFCFEGFLPVKSQVHLE